MLGFVTFFPFFRGEGEIAPEILPKNVSDIALVADLSQPNGVTYENRKHSFERGIIVLRFGGSYTCLLLPIWEEVW